MVYQHILSELRSEVLYVTINRERKLNALNKETLAELADVIAYAESTAAVKAVLLTGAGEKAFVAGADISEFAAFSAAEGEELARAGQYTVFDAIERCPKPVVAAINGFALGGGLELAMACHIRLAADHARLGLPEVSLGLIPGYGGTQRLTQLVGKGHAMELIATAEMISAARAAEIGLVKHVVPMGELQGRSEELIEKIKLRSPSAISYAIKAINAALSHEENGFETEITSFGACFGTADFKEGTTAFLEKRKPHFTG